MIICYQLFLGVRISIAAMIDGVRRCRFASGEGEARAGHPRLPMPGRPRMSR